MKRIKNTSFLKIVLVTLSMLFSLNLFSQQEKKIKKKGILLERKESRTYDFLSENRKIKITTGNGKEFKGHFSIVNDSVICMKNTEIALDSIVRIKRFSVTNSILSSLFLYSGIAIISTGIIVVASGGIGYILVATLPTGSIMVVITAISQNHKPSKWKYSIAVKPKPRWL